MTTIWKFELNITDRQAVLMPNGAKILTVQMQYDCLCVWAQVDPELRLHPRIIEIFGTGRQMDDAARNYIATFQLNGGDLVFHVYERLA